MNKNLCSTYIYIWYIDIKTTLLEGGYSQDLGHHCINWKVVRKFCIAQTKHVQFRNKRDKQMFNEYLQRFLVILLWLHENIAVLWWIKVCRMIVVGRSTDPCWFNVICQHLVAVKSPDNPTSNWPYNVRLS